jgi:hypothetical protein
VEEEVGGFTLNEMFSPFAFNQPKAFLALATSDSLKETLGGLGGIFHGDDSRVRGRST